MTFLALSLLTSGISLSLLCAAVGLIFAFILIFTVVKSSPGNARMQEIAGAIQEGAKAYLNRQVITISSIAVVIFLLLFFFKDHASAVGFVVGASVRSPRDLSECESRFLLIPHNPGRDQVDRSGPSRRFQWRRRDRPVGCRFGASVSWDLLPGRREYGWSGRRGEESDRPCFGC